MKKKLKKKNGIIMIKNQQKSSKKAKDKKKRVSSKEGIRIIDLAEFVWPNTNYIWTPHFIPNSNCFNLK